MPFCVYIYIYQITLLLALFFFSREKVFPIKDLVVINDEANGSPSSPT